MLKSKMMAILATSLTILCLQANAQEIKMATIDMAKVFDHYWKTDVQKKDLAKFQVQAKSHIEKEQQTLREMDEERNKLRQDALILGDEERKEAEDKINEITYSMQQKLAGLQDYQRRENRRVGTIIEKNRKQLLEDIMVQVNKYAKENKLDLIVDSSGNSLNRIPTFVFVKDSYDITDKIISMVNADAPKDGE